MDTITDMLRTTRLTGGVFLEAEFSAPWCVTAQVGPEDCAPFTPVPRHIIAFHYVISGKLLLKHDRQSPIGVGPSEIVILPRNDPHLLGSALDIRPISADHLIRPALDGGRARIVHGGGGERTQIVCGFLGSDMPHNPVLGILPSVLTLGVAEGASAEWIENSFRFAARELTHGRIESSPILADLAEILFKEAVRRYLRSQGTAAASWTAAANDPIVARGLVLLHNQMARRWRTDDLARESGLSRSAFAERFTRLLGEPPMRYLARLKLEEACMRLRETSDATACIAYEVGYESEPAFNRAFKREYGIPPALWRKDQLKRGPLGREQAIGPANRRRQDKWSSDLANAPCDKFRRGN